MAQPRPAFDVQGHRGARGLSPENTIPAFMRALDERVTTLEMDVVVTADHQIVVSHEPWMNASICKDSLGNPIAARNAKKFNIYQMTYAEVQKFDCGSKKNRKFSEQQPVAATKPLLVDVIRAVEDRIKDEQLRPVDYNIEIKTSPRGGGIYHPDPEQFSDMLYALLDQYLPWERIIIQSFDFDVLRYWRSRYPQARLSALVEKTGAVADYIEKLGFLPTVYSPYYTLLNLSDVKYLHAHGVRVIPWTVNEIANMTELKAMGVDGLITDYPNRAAHLDTPPAATHH